METVVLWLLMRAVLAAQLKPLRRVAAENEPPAQALSLCSVLNCPLVTFDPVHGRGSSWWLCLA